MCNLLSVYVIACFYVLFCVLQCEYSWIVIFYSVEFVSYSNLHGKYTNWFNVIYCFLITSYWNIFETCSWITSANSFYIKLYFVIIFPKKNCFKMVYYFILNDNLKNQQLPFEDSYFKLQDIFLVIY